MPTLEQLTGGEWFEVRERMHRPANLHEYLFPSDHPDAALAAARALRLRESAQLLADAVEGGIFEFRTHEAAAVCNTLAEAEFTSEVLSNLPRHAERLSVLLLVTVTQRALITGELELRAVPDDADEQDAGDGQPAGSSSTPEDRDVSAIISDVKEILAADPDAKMHAAIKNILLQVQKYRQEAETFRKLKQQANDYRLEMYSRTFAASFKKIFESIRRNYAAFLEEQEAARQAAAGSVLRGMDLGDWGRLLLGHTERVSRLRSTVLFASREHSGMREPLVRAAAMRGELLKEIAREEDVAADASGGEAAGYRLSRLIARDISVRLRRWAGPEPGHAAQARGEDGPETPGSPERP